VVYWTWQIATDEPYADGDRNLPAEMGAPHGAPGEAGAPCGDPWFAIHTTTAVCVTVPKETARPGRGAP
jgi:hypothetical protein